MENKITAFNIRDFFNEDSTYAVGEKSLTELISEFSCGKNPAVEKFLKENAIDFAKKNQSVTYLVFAGEEASFVGYFTLAIKPICVNVKKFSNTLKRKIGRVSSANKKAEMYTLSAYLLAQLGKNERDGANHKITGKQLLEVAASTIKALQYQVGGMVMFLETENVVRLLQFYEAENGFKKFAVRKTQENTEEHTLVQLLKII